VESSRNTIEFMVQLCRAENNIDKKVEILKSLNLLLPDSKRIKLQSMFTRDYVENVLSLIEGSEEEDDEVAG